MNYKEIINDANGVLNSNEATNINIIEWVKPQGRWHTLHWVLNQMSILEYPLKKLSA